MRASEISDASSFHALVRNNSERLKEAFPKSIKAAESMEAAKNYILQLNKNLTEKSSFHFFIFSARGNNLLGVFFIKSIDWTVPKCELAYFIDAQMEGKGLVKEGMKTVTDYCFDHLGMKKLFIRTGISNKRSSAIALACGFEKEGLLRNDFRTGNGDLQDIEYFGKIKTK